MIDLRKKTKHLFEQMTILLCTAVILLAAQAMSAPLDPETPTDVQPLSGGSGWNLEWSDEFNGTSLDTTKWTKDVSTKSRAPRPFQGIDDWWWKAENAFLDGTGNLILRVEKHDSNTMYCGSVNSNDKYEPVYGYFEARIKNADTVKGSHTAFWLQGNNQGLVDGTANDGAEIDIYESAWATDETASVVHIDGYGASHQANTKHWSAPGIHDGYHVYGLEWTPDYLKIYYDGVLKAQYTDTQWVPWSPEFLWLSDGASFVDGEFDQQPVGWLTDAKVDYVRVWKNSDSDFPTLIDDASDSVTYNNWNAWTAGTAYLSTLHYSNVAGAAATFSFTGTQAVFYGMTRSDLGYADIYIDGNYEATVDCYSSETAHFQTLFETPILAYGNHTLTVKVTGDYNPAATASDGEIIIDAFGYLSPKKWLYDRKDYTTNTVRGHGAVEAGNKFVTGANPPTITGLGIIDLHNSNPAVDPDGDGLLQPHRVTLWRDSDGSNVAEVIVPEGTSGKLSGSFRYKAILSGPVTLAANTAYVVSTDIDGIQDPWLEEEELTPNTYYIGDNMNDSTTWQGRWGASGTKPDSSHRTGTFYGLVNLTVEKLLLADFDDSGRVDIYDLAEISQFWLQDAAFYDIAPEGGDGIINLLDFQVLAEEWVP